MTDRSSETGPRRGNAIPGAGGVARLKPSADRKDSDANYVAALSADGAGITGRRVAGVGKSVSIAVLSLRAGADDIRTGSSGSAGG